MALGVQDSPGHDPGNLNRMAVSNLGTAGLRLLAMGLLLVASCRQSSKDEKDREDDTATTANDDDDSTCEEDDDSANDDDDTLSAPECGDSVVEPPEICEPGWFRECEADGYPGRQACLSDCEGWAGCVTGEGCGDGIVNGPEVCDGGEEACETAPGQYNRSRACSPDCQRWEECVPSERCGDGIVHGSELCDGLGNICFSPLGYLGHYRCFPDCSGTDYLSPDSCQPAGFCGDGIRNGHEYCDGDGIFGCLAVSGPLGYVYRGRGRCTDQCRVDDCMTTEWCGDNIRNGGEICDGYDTIEGGRCHEDCQGMDCLPGATPDSFWHCYMKKDLPGMLSGEFIRCIDGRFRFEVAGSDLFFDLCSDYGPPQTYIQFGRLGSPLYPNYRASLELVYSAWPASPYKSEILMIRYDEYYDLAEYIYGLLDEFIDDEIKGEVKESVLHRRGASGDIRIEGTKLYVTGLVIHWDQGDDGREGPARYRTIEAEFSGVVQ